MGSRGDNWLKRSIVGSVTQATFRQSSLPVLVLSQQGNSLFLDGGALHILVPLDGSELAESVLEPVFQLLSLVTTPAPHRVHLLRVIAAPSATSHLRSEAHSADTFQKEEDQAAIKALLQTLAERLPSSKLAASHCVITSSVVTHPDVAGTIVKYSQAATDDGTPSYDMIALATHGRTGLRRALMGSVTERVFGATALPLLVVHPVLAQSYVEQTELGKEGRAQEENPQSWVGLL